MATVYSALKHRGDRFSKRNKKLWDRRRIAYTDYLTNMTAADHFMEVLKNVESVLLSPTLSQTPSGSNARIQLTEEIQTLERLLKQQERIKNPPTPLKTIKMLLIIGGVLAAAFLGLAFFMPSLRPASHIVILIALVLFALYKLFSMIGTSMESANPNVPSYAVTMGEMEGKSRREASMGCSAAIAGIGAIIFLIGMLLTWDEVWWYELVGLGILGMSILMGR